MSIFGDTDAERKSVPIFDGAIMYFPRALAAIAKHSKTGNDKHNPGEPLHWDKTKSTDHRNTQLRHLIDDAMGERFDIGSTRHLCGNAWRALALLETQLEKEDWAKNHPGRPDRSIQGVDGPCPVQPAPHPMESAQAQCCQRPTQPEINAAAAAAGKLGREIQGMAAEVAGLGGKWYPGKSP